MFRDRIVNKSFGAFEIAKNVAGRRRCERSQRRFNGQV